jgi:hypothetical protein
MAAWVAQPAVLADSLKSPLAMRYAVRGARAGLELGAGRVYVLMVCFLRR